MSKLNSLEFKDKVKLTNDVKELTPAKLGDVVEIIKENCSAAFKKIDDDNFQIMVDKLDKKTFDKIYTRINEINGIKKIKTQ